MIQDIAPHQYRNEYRSIPPDKDSILLCYEGRKVLVKHSAEGILFPTFAEAEECNSKEKLYEDYTYLFTIDNMKFYLSKEISYSALTEYVWEDVCAARGYVHSSRAVLFVS